MPADSSDGGVSPNPLDRRLVLLLRVATASCFAAWAWQHLRWSGPYASLLLNPDIFGFVEMFGIEWIEWINEIMTEERILLLSRIIGVFFGLVALAAVFVSGRRRFPHVLLWLGSFVLCLTAAGIAVHDRSGVLWIEQAGQIGCPILLSLAIFRGPRSPAVLVTAIVALWAVFISHGLFAAGVFQIPGSFLSMTHAILQLDERGTVTFLRIVGLLDFVICVACLIPVLRKPALAYACLWGLLTAAARPVAGMSLLAPYWGADVFLHETFQRLPHAAIPAFLFFAWRRKVRSSDGAGNRRRSSSDGGTGHASSAEPAGGLQASA
ncbi:hypothetical protein Hhel01_02277 [Haloferula helveola]